MRATYKLSFFSLLLPCKLTFHFSAALCLFYDFFHSYEILALSSKFYAIQKAQVCIRSNTKERKRKKNFFPCDKQRRREIFFWDLDEFRSVFFFSMIINVNSRYLLLIEWDKKWKVYHKSFSVRAFLFSQDHRKFA